MKLISKGVNPAEPLPEGSTVLLVDDYGNIYETRTRSEPWQLGSGTWVVSVEGKSGGYSLDRISKPSQETKP